MLKFYNKLILLIAVLSVAVSLFTACSSIVYGSPGRAKISQALDGAAWPLNLPAPAYIDKFLAKFKYSGDGCVEIRFLGVSQNELKAYVKALRRVGFKITPAVSGVSEYSVQQRAAKGDYDWYRAEKGELSVDVSAKPDVNNDVYIRISGLSGAEIEALRVQSREEEIEELERQEKNIEGQEIFGESGAYMAGFGVWKEYLIDIGKNLNGHIQPEITATDPGWLPAIPAPAFIERAPEWPAGRGHSSYGEGFSFAFGEVDMQELFDYLLLLRSKGFQIVQPIEYFFHENAKPHGALDYENFRTLEGLFLSYCGIYELRADNGRYTLRFLLDRVYIVREVYRGDDENLTQNPDKGPVGLTLDVAGLSREEMVWLGLQLADDPAYRYEIPEEINHSGYTIDQVNELLIFALQRQYVTGSEATALSELLIVQRDIDGVLDHEGIKRALEDEECPLPGGA